MCAHANILPEPWVDGVFVGLGANLPSPAHGAPADTLQAALDTLESPDIRVLRRSRWYRTAPVPVSDQPWFVNAVAELATRLSPDDLLARLHVVEDTFGRVRRQRNEARLIDLDLLDFAGRVSEEGTAAILPHPRLHLRAFALRPLAELAPGWRHPVTGRPIDALLAAIPADQACEPVPAD